MRKCYPLFFEINEILFNTDNMSFRYLNFVYFCKLIFYINDGFAYSG